MNIVMADSEDTRKIQFTGNSTYIISLPKKWINELGLKQGDQVSIGRKGISRLEVSPYNCLLYTSPSPRDKRQSRMPSSA